jgi:hypothetical protein
MEDGSWKLEDRRWKRKEKVDNGFYKKRVLLLNFG